MADNGDSGEVNTNGSSPRRRSRSPVRSRSRSRSPRDWKRGERNRQSGRDRPRTSRWGGSGTGSGNVGVSGGGGGGKVRLYVSNIPYEVRWQDLKDIFKKEVGSDVTYVEMFDGPDGKSMGAGVVEVRTREAAEKAIDKMHKYEVKGRKVIVREEREKDRIRHQKGGGGGGMGGGDMMGGGGNMGGGGGGMNMGGGGGGMNMGGGGGMNMGGGMSMNMGGGGGGGGGGINMSNANLPPGLTPQICAQYNIDPDHITNQVFVANLDYKVSSRKLKEIFKMAGNVTTVELKEDKDGNSRGMGVVKFEHPMEAVQAISMFHNQVLYDRVLTVKMDKHGDSAFASPSLPSKLPSGLKSIGMGLGQGGQPINVNQLPPGGPSIPATSFSSNLSAGMGMGNMGMGGMAGMGMNSNNMAQASSLGMGGIQMSNLSGGGGMGSNMSQMGAMGGGSTGMSGGGYDSMGSMGMSDMGSNMNTSMSAMGSLSSMGGRGMDSYSGMGGGAGRSGDGIMSSIGSSRLSSGGGGGMSGGGAGGMFEETCTVFVRNLPFSVTWQNLRDQFKECGDVKFAELKMDEQGRSKGYGTVRFALPEDARRAVNLMNSTRVQGRQIEVRLNKV